VPDARARERERENGWRSFPRQTTTLLANYSLKLIHVLVKISLNSS